MSERLFTVAEANALIPRLEIIMGKLQRHGVTLRDAIGALARAGEMPPEDFTTAQILELRPHLRPVVEELETLLQEIDALGVQMKGLDLGLIDFPAEWDGEVVLLCWQYGEREIGYYHTLETGFAGRKPLNPKAGSPRYLQ